MIAMRDVAERGVLRGAEIVRERTERAATEKGAGDYVTDVDVASERAIVELLRTETPDVPVLGEEEGGARLSAGGRAWVVDPLDGTTNFVHGFPVVGVSVALVEDGIPVAGAVAAPFLRERTIAASGAGAIRIDERGRRRRASVSDRPPPRAIVGTGFPFRRKENLPRYLRVFEGALERFEDLRRPGAAALDLAWVAAGVFDGFFELGLSPWDVAAGALLIREAGGVVSDWAGGEGWLGGDILAGPPTVHAELLRLATSGTPSPR
jgi:myo-inositol-1(or 4)-monophosphatase